MGLRQARRRNRFELPDGESDGAIPEADWIRHRPAVEVGVTPLELEELTGLVWGGVRRLPERYRAAVTHRLRGDENSELAERLGVCASTARVRVHRGLRLLRKDLSERHQGFSDDGPSPRERQRHG